MSSLYELPVLFLDGQTTGGSAERHRLIEIAWCRGTAGAYGEVWSSTVRLPPGESLSPAITKLTGLTPEDVARGLPPVEVWAELLGTIRSLPAPEPAQGRLPLVGTGVPRVLVVAHYARFEASFLRALHAAHGAEAPFPLRFLCTHEMGRRLFPDLPRRGLRALSGYLGASLGELKRASSHAEATAIVWGKLVAALRDERGVESLGQLERFLARPPRPRTGAWCVPLPRRTRLDLPGGPGVYRFLGARGEVLYVGKATSLKGRVNSYFRARKAEDKVLRLITETHDLDVTPTPSTLEAALLEASLIRELSPPYNRALRDEGRELVYATADLGEVRPIRDRRHRLGPFPGPEAITIVRSLHESLAGGPDGSDARRLESNPSALRTLGLERGDLEPGALERGLALFREAHVRGSLGSPILLWVLGGRLLREIRREEAESRAEAELREETERRAEAARRSEGGAGAAMPERSVPTFELRSEPQAGPTKGSPALARDGRPTIDASAVRDACRLALAHAARLRNRGRWLEWLADAEVRWEMRGGGTTSWRVLVLERGKAISAASATGASPPDSTPPGPVRGSSWSGGDPGLDRATYDQLRVLTTELRRIVGRGRRVEVIGSGRRLETAEVARILGRV